MAAKLYDDDDEKPGLRLRSSQGAGLERDPSKRRDEPVDDREEIALPEDSNVHIDGQTGAAIIEEKGGGVVIDFSGRDSRKTRPGRAPKITGFNENLAEKEGFSLGSLATRVMDGTESDIRNRAEWEEMGNKGAELLGVRWQDASIDVSPEGSISKACHPMLLEAILRSWANARAELLPAAGPVKVRDDMPTDEMDAQAELTDQESAGAPGVMQKRRRSDKADHFEKDMNHNLTVVDRGYYDDFGRMLMARAFKGSQFRKVFFDPVTQRPMSRWVMGTDLIISNDGTDLTWNARVTERAMVSQAMVRRMQVEGYWRDVSLGLPTPIASPTDRSTEEISGIARIETSALPADYRHEIRECKCFCDEGDLALDENGKDVGFPLPYRVTIDTTSRQILSVVRDWKEGDERYIRRKRHVHYGFVPTIYNTFYHWGLVHLMGSSQRAATAMEREFIDSEMLASFPGGVMAKGPATKTDQTILRGGPGQFAVIETGGEPIANVVMPWPYKGASLQLGAILDKVVAEARRMAGTLEIPVGEGRVGNVPVGTVMAFVDSISKIPSAVFKDDHISQQEEYGLLKELFEEHPECVLSDDPKRNAAWTKEELSDQALVPASDPNTPSYVHRIMQAMAVAEMLKLYGQMPGMAQIPNARAIWIWLLKVLGVEGSQEFTMPVQQPGPPQPDPAAATQMVKAQNDAKKNEIAQQKLGIQQEENQREAANQGVEADQRAADRQSEEKIEQMRLEAETMRAQNQMAHEKNLAGMEHAVDVHKHQTGLAHEASQTAQTQAHEAQQTEAGLAQADTHHQEKLGHERGLAEQQGAKDDGEAAP